MIFEFLLLRIFHVSTSLLVERLGVGGGGRNVRVTGSLVRASGELELIGGLEVGIAGGAVGGGVILEVEKESEHFCENAMSKRFQTILHSKQHKLQCTNEIQLKCHSNLFGDKSRRVTSLLFNFPPI